MFLLEATFSLGEQSKSAREFSFHNERQSQARRHRFTQRCQESFSQGTFLGLVGGYRKWEPPRPVLLIELERLEGVKQYNTTSAENVGTAWIEVQERYDVADVMKRVRSRVDAISTFPPDAEKPIIEEFIYRDLIVLVSLSGDTSERRLKEWAQNT